MTTQAPTPSDADPTPLGWVLLVVFLLSLGTGVFWHGLAFIAKHSYGFGQTRNLVLYAVMGSIYTGVAFRAGSLTRSFERVVSPRGLLAVVVGVQGLACLVPVVFRSELALWASGIAVTLAAAIAWPIIESYLTAGRHGPSMRSAIARFNLVWMSAVVVPMIAMAPILAEHGRWAIGGVAGANVIAVGVLAFFPPRPARHDAVTASGHLTPGYPFLLRSARVLLPVSYLLSSVMSPLLPYRFEQLGVDVSWETPCTAIWMVTRVLALVVMWRWPFWHGRWGTLVVAALTMVFGFALVVLAPTLPMTLIGFATLGVGLGAVYYAALYYAMAVGGAAVDASGTHEALIGTGYAVGPLAGLLGAAIAGGIGVTGGTGIVGLVSMIVVLSAVPAIGPYRRWRRSSP